MTGKYPTISATPLDQELLQNTMKTEKPRTVPVLKSAQIHPLLKAHRTVFTQYRRPQGEYKETKGDTQIRRQTM